MFTKDISLTVTEGGTSQLLVLAAATNNAGMNAMTEGGYVVVTVDSVTFVRKGTAPVAVNTGVDQVLLATNAYRIGPLLAGEKLAFISTTGGNVYITPQG